MDRDEIKSIYDAGQQYLSDAAKTGDTILAMRGRALCHRAIELMWHAKQSQGQVLDPPWVRRRIDPFLPPWSVNELGKGDPIFIDELNTEPKQLKLFS